MTTNLPLRKDLPLIEIWKQRREVRERQKMTKEICLWMDNYILPFLEGVAKNYDEPLIPGVERLIRENKNPFRPRTDWDRSQETRDTIGAFITHPVTSALWRIAKPYLRGRMDKILDETDWVINTVLQEEYPDVYDAIMQTDGGVEWFKALLTDLAQTLRPIAK